MCDHSQKMERARVFLIGIADKPVEAFSIGQSAGAMMSHRGCERPFGRAPGTHGGAGLMSVAGPISSAAQIHFAGASVHPDRLIAGQRARQPIPRITSSV